MFTKDQKGIHNHPENGQPDGCILCKPNRRNTFPEPKQTDNPTVAMVPRKEPAEHLPRGGQLHSKPGSQPLAEWQLERDIPADNDSAGRIFCLPHD